MRTAGWPMILGALAVAAIAGAGCNSTAPIPAEPAYDTDVRPILMAHCVRCHGAGGSLNVATEPTGPDAAVLPSIAGSVGSFKALPTYFDQFGTTGTCTADTNGNYPADCRLGASIYATTMPSYIHAATNLPEAMPPPPAPRLDDWALGVIDAWAKESPVICSHAPSSSLCPAP